MACADANLFVSLTGSAFLTVGPSSTATITWLGAGSPGDTITVGSVTMTGVAGARVAGSDTWSTDGTVSDQITSFLAAVSDSSLTLLVTGSASGSVLTLTTIATGAVSEIAISISDALVYELSGATFDGGSDLVDWTLVTTCSMLGLCWGSKQQAGAVYLAAHFLSIQTGKGGGESGAVTSKSIDRISIGYTQASFNPNDAAFASTKWGRLYLGLKSTLPSIGAVSSNSFGIIGTGGRC